jgi:nucleoid DNA-binding protein
MNKSELIEKVAAEMDCTEKEAKEVINTIFATMTDALANGQGIQIGALAVLQQQRTNRRHLRLVRIKKSSQLRVSLNVHST